LEDVGDQALKTLNGGNIIISALGGGDGGNAVATPWLRVLGVKRGREKERKRGKKG